MNIHQDKLLILDFGSQYTQLIARRVREIGVYCEIFPYSVSEEKVKNFSPKGIILSGGPESVTDATTPRIPEVVFQIGCPVLGVCYGMQAMAIEFGGEVEASSRREFGHSLLAIVKPSRLFAGLLEKELNIWMSHGDHVTQVPVGFDVIAATKDAPIAAISNEEKNLYAVQFHPEVTHTKKGREILENFILSICQCQVNWVPEKIIEESIVRIREQVRDENVVLGLSGGVDSSVVAALLHRAIPNQLICVFVDTGLLRLNEAEQVRENFSHYKGVEFICVDAKEEFYQALKGIVEPEKKRKIIGELFVKIFQKEASSMKKIKWLAQGTIYPDVIESADTGLGPGQVIKTHHNVGGLPDELPFKLLEPLRELFKDEVRKIGLELGLPNQMVYRHPFPGPGLAVRILGEVKSEYVEILRQADAIFIEELYRYDYYHRVSQAFSVFLPVKSVGVVGDARCYDYVIALRAVETVDFMTAHWARLPYELLECVSSRIMNEVLGVSRVTYDISSKPPATIEWE